MGLNVIITITSTFVLVTKIRTLEIMVAGIGISHPALDYYLASCILESGNALKYTHLCASHGIFLLIYWAKV